MAKDTAPMEWEEVQQRIRDLETENARLRDRIVTLEARTWNGSPGLSGTRAWLYDPPPHLSVALTLVCGKICLGFVTPAWLQRPVGMPACPVPRSQGSGCSSTCRGPV